MGTSNGKFSRCSALVAAAFGSLLMAVGCSGRTKADTSDPTTSAAAIGSDSQEQLERYVLGAAFTGIDGALAAYDMGELQFLQSAFSVIGNLPHDGRIEAFVQQGDDVVFPVFCAKLVALRRTLAVPSDNSDGSDGTDGTENTDGTSASDATSKCLAQITDFETKVGPLVQTAEADYEVAVRLIPGATTTEKLQSLRQFYDNFGGPGSGVDGKVNTAIALSRLFQDYQGATQGGDQRLTATIAALTRSSRDIVSWARVLGGETGYIDGDSYARFFDQLDTVDLRLVLTKLLPWTGLNQTQRELVLAIYDDHSQALLPQLFRAIYPRGATPYASVLQQLGVERSEPPSLGHAGTPGGAIKLSALIDLWNAALNGNSSQPYRDLVQRVEAAARSGSALSAKSIDVRTGILARFSFPRGLPSSKLATAVEQQTLPLDLVVNSTQDANTIIIQ